MCGLCMKESDHFPYATFIKKKKTRVKKKWKTDSVSLTKNLADHRPVVTESRDVEVETIKPIHCQYDHNFQSYFRDVSSVHATSHRAIIVNLNATRLLIDRFVNIRKLWDRHPQNVTNQYFLFEIFSYQLSSSTSSIPFDWNHVLSFILYQVCQINYDPQLMTLSQLLEVFPKENIPPLDVIVLADNQDIVLLLMTRIYTEVLSHMLTIQAYTLSEPSSPSTSPMIKIDANGNLQSYSEDEKLVSSIISL